MPLQVRHSVPAHAAARAEVTDSRAIQRPTVGLSGDFGDSQPFTVKGAIAVYDPSVAAEEGLNPLVPHPVEILLLGVTILTLLAIATILVLLFIRLRRDRRPQGNPPLDAGAPRATSARDG